MGEQDRTGELVGEPAEPPYWRTVLLNGDMDPESLERYGLVGIDWLRRGPLAWRLPLPIYRPRPTPWDTQIRMRVSETRKLGEQPLWSGYGEPDATREPAVVETRHVTGRFYSALARILRPAVVVEFGTAFGVSGMHWLAGLVKGRGSKQGHLHTFEVNPEWADVAETNLRSIGPAFTLHRGLFEEMVDGAVSEPIDIAFIDGIHRPEWVEPQVDLVANRLSPGGVIVLDDINFSDAMTAYWHDVALQERVWSAARVTERVGLLQLR